MAKSNYVPLLKWAASQNPPIHPARARQLWKRIKGAKRVAIEGAKPSKNDHFILVPRDAPDPRQRDAAGRIKGGRPVAYSPVTKYLKAENQ